MKLKFLTKIQLLIISRSFTPTSGYPPMVNADGLARRGRRWLADLKKGGATCGLILADSACSALLRSANQRSPSVCQALNCVHEINLKPGTKPVKQRVRRVPVNLRAELKKSIDSMLERGIIRHSTSEWASSIVLVTKKTGELRVWFNCA